MRISESARTILKGYETGGENINGRLVVFKKATPALVAYIDDVGVPTIGWGHTGSIRGQRLKAGMTCTLDEAEDLLSADISKFEIGVTNMLGDSETNQNQFDALVLLAFNIGIEGLLRSTLMKKHKAGDFAAAAKQFGLWNKGRVNGKLVVLNGLTRRRAEEASIYQRPVVSIVSAELVVPPSIQAVANFEVTESKRVEPEAPKAPSKSPSVIGGIIATVTAIPLTVENVTMATNSLREVRAEADQVQTLAWMSSALGIIIFLLATYIIWRRFQDHREGIK